MSAMIPFFSSCSDDDSVNEWDMSYVSLLPADYLRPTPSFTLKHVEEEGIEGSVEFQFMATTQKAVAHHSLNIFSEILFYRLSLYISRLQMYSFGLNIHEISRF